MTRIDDAFEEIIALADYSMVQSGEDLSREGTSKYGYHDTSEKCRDVFFDRGLGAHPGTVEYHEAPFWVATFCPAKYGRKASMLMVDNRTRGRHGDAIAGEVVSLLSKGLSTMKDLRVVWFYRDPELRGTSSCRGARIVLDLERIGDWLAHHSDYVVTTSDNAGGDAIAWVGSPIPPDVFAAPPTSAGRASGRVEKFSGPRGTFFAEHLGKGRVRFSMTEPGKHRPVFSTELDEESYKNARRSIMKKGYR